MSNNTSPQPPHASELLKQGLGIQGTESSHIDDAMTLQSVITRYSNESICQTCRKAYAHLCPKIQGKEINGLKSKAVKINLRKRKDNELIKTECQRVDFCPLYQEDEYVLNKHKKKEYILAKFSKTTMIQTNEWEYRLLESFWDLVRKDLKSNTVNLATGGYDIYNSAIRFIKSDYLSDFVSNTTIDEKKIRECFGSLKEKPKMGALELQEYKRTEAWRIK